DAASNLVSRTEQTPASLDSGSPAAIGTGQHKGEPPSARKQDGGHTPSAFHQQVGEEIHSARSRSRHGSEINAGTTRSGVYNQNGASGGHNDAFYNGNNEYEGSSTTTPYEQDDPSPLHARPVASAEFVQKPMDIPAAWLKRGRYTE
ncbi:unnamed protein product, partial [Amoebophrya sp. A25]